MNLVEVSKAGEGVIPFTKNTCYKFHSQKKHPNLIIKIAGKLFCDMDEWQVMAQKAKEKSMKESKRLREVKT